MKTIGVQEKEIKVQVNGKEAWKDVVLEDFSLWNQEYDTRMKAEDHLVLSTSEVEVLNKNLVDADMIMDVDLVTSNIHVVPEGIEYGEVLIDFYNTYIKDQEWNPLENLEVRGGSFAWKPWKNKVWLRVVDGDVIYLAHFESVAFRNTDQKMVAKLADVHFYKGFGWDQVHTKEDDGIQFFLPEIDEQGNLINYDNSYIPEINVSMLFDSTTMEMEKAMLARHLVYAFKEYIEKDC